jgi:hypothetical protein
MPPCYHLTSLDAGRRRASGFEHFQAGGVAPAVHFAPSDSLRENLFGSSRRANPQTDDGR